MAAMPTPSKKFTGRKSITVSPKMARRCSRCEAAPGHSCGRRTGSGFWVALKYPHKER